MPNSELNSKANSAPNSKTRFEAKTELNDEKSFHLEPNKKYFNISVYTLIVVLIGSIIIKIVFNWTETSAFWGHYLSALSPFFVGFFIAYLLSPLVSFINTHICAKRLKIRNQTIRGIVSIFSSYGIVIAIIIIIFQIMIPQIIDSCMDIVMNRFPEWFIEINTFVNHTLEQLSDSEYAYIVDFLNNTFAIDNLLDFERITSIATNLLTTTIPTLITTSYSLVMSIVSLLIALIYSIYMLFDRRLFGKSIKRLLYALFPEKFVDNLVSTAAECNHIFIHYITGKLIDSLIIGTLCFIAMNILKLPYSMLISVIVGITNMIPYFGPWIGAIPGALILLLMEPMNAFVYIILVFILQQFDGFILGPKILGESTGLRPVWILFSISAGSAVAGVLGMFLGVPVVAVIMYLITRWIDARLEKRQISPEQLEMKDDTAEFFSTEDTLQD
ncbi:MAG: AI-2E family transporter [Lachnospiraceae bacterium]